MAHPLWKAIYPYLTELSLYLLFNPGISALGMYLDVTKGAQGKVEAAFLDNSKGWKKMA